ncbi:Hpt domain-containing protein [Edaphobacter sp. HDX4]|uniref:Hpt domain-containing protein n=1 Tax=Edaphobacter sp. HDX4 TaxID=2794064 RepID=UPI002FE5B091
MISPSMNPGSQPDPEIFALLQDLWQRHLPSTRERLELLEQAVHKAVSNTLDEDTRVEAQSVAHKLSGNLGMFGYKDAGEIAGEIEHLFKTFVPSATPQLTSYMERLRVLLQGHI